MAPRSEDDKLTESELAKPKCNLLLLSGPHPQDFYRDAHKACILKRKPNLKAMQQLEGDAAAGRHLEGSSRVGMEMIWP